MSVNPEKSLNSSFKSMDHDSLNKNQLNNSISKMQYSFPKDERFPENKKYNFSSFRLSSSNMFYEIPTTKTMRATSFGYGQKLDLGKKNFVTPSPDKYELGTDFKKSPKLGFTMAPGRGDVKANDMFRRPLKQSPEPASYNPKPLEKSIRYSLHIKLEDSTDKWVKSVPGPGSYSYLDLTSKGKSPVAKHESVTSGKFDKLPRLSEVETRRNKNPGPNEYKNTAEILNTYKYEKKGGNSFSKSARQGIVNKSFTPGPGNYNSFSEF